MVGELDKAVEHLRAACEASRYTAQYHSLACCDLAEALLERGKIEDRTEAAAVLDEALAQAEGRGILPVAARARRLLEGLRGSAPAPRPAGLSERELEVLRILAAGKSNKEIAFELSISEKTVHSHVASIFGKLGVGNRTEAAAFALKQNLAGTPR
jgi:DNA-binding NarL/FixJ family response regulator